MADQSEGADAPNLNGNGVELLREFEKMVRKLTTELQPASQGGDQHIQVQHNLQQQHTKPQHTKPQHTKPQHTKPQHTKPQHTKPQHTKPQHTKPQHTKLHRIHTPQQTKIQLAKQTWTQTDRCCNLCQCQAKGANASNTANPRRETQPLVRVLMEPSEINLTIKLNTWIADNGDLMVQPSLVKDSDLGPIACWDGSDPVADCCLKEQPPPHGRKDATKLRAQQHTGSIQGQRQQKQLSWQQQLLQQSAASKPGDTQLEFNNARSVGKGSAVGSGIGSSRGVGSGGINSRGIGSGEIGSRGVSIGSGGIGSGDIGSRSGSGVAMGDIGLFRGSNRVRRSGKAAIAPPVQTNNHQDNWERSENSDKTELIDAGCINDAEEDDSMSHDGDWSSASSGDISSSDDVDNCKSQELRCCGSGRQQFAAAKGHPPTQPPSLFRGK